MSAMPASLHVGDYGQHFAASGGPMQTNCYWPAEIVDSMAWSAQFFDFGHGRSGHTEGVEQRQGENNESM